MRCVRTVVAVLVLLSTSALADQTYSWQPALRGVPISGMDIPKNFRADGAQCYVYSERTVLVTTHQDPFSDEYYDVFTVLKNPSPSPDSAACSLQPARVVYELDRRENAKFLGLWKNLLLLDNGTGKERSLVIYDITKPVAQGSVYDRNYAPPYTFKEGIFTFYTEDDLNPAGNKCKGLHDLSPGYDSELSLNLKTVKATATGKGRCIKRQ